MWTNWSGGQECRPSATVRPMDDAGVVGVVRQAGERGQTVRPLGSGHSFSALAVTDDVHVDCSALSGITAVHARAGGRTSVRVRAGTTIGELHAALADRGLALDVPLDLTDPTVGGALAVGMHGSGVTRTSLSEHVVGMRLVDGRARVRDVPPAELDAARCALGALGVVLDVELAVVPAGTVRVTRSSRTVDEVLDPAFWGGHLVAEAALFPSSPTALARWVDPVDDPGPPDPGPDGEPAEAGADPERERSVGVTTAGVTGRTALGGAMVVERALPRLVPRLNRVVSRLARTVTATGAMHRVLSTPPSGRYEQTEWALDRDALAPAARALVTALAGDLEPGLPVRLRVGDAESGWLHPAHDRPTGWIGVRVPRGGDPAPVLAAATEVLADHGGRPHWASRHALDAAALAPLYPRLDDFRRVRDDYDPDRVFVNAALEELLGS